jgi:tetratricopeptide (TPR) repeat protein
MALWQGQQETALAKLQEALVIEQMLEDDRMVATTQMANGIAFINMGRDGEAKPLLEAASQFFKAANPYFHALTLVHLGNAELGLGNPDKAYAYHSKAEAAARQIHENWLISFALNNLGEVARVQGQYDVARKYYEECESLLPDAGDNGDRARFVHSLGYIAQHEGDYERAEAQFRKSLRMFRRLGNRRGMAECMAGLASLKARQGQAEWGAVMLSAANSVLKVTGGAWWPADRVEVERNQEMIRSMLGETEWNAAQKKGAVMSLEQALAFASE